MNAAAQQQQSSTIPAIGTPMLGGFFTGIVSFGGQTFGVVVAPKATEIQGKWAKAGMKLDDCKHIADGMGNTLAMAAAGSDIAKKVLALEIPDDDNGRWYIPARDELELIYRNLKPTDQENGCYFRDGENLSSVPLGFGYTETMPQRTEVAAFSEGGTEAMNPNWYWSSTQYSAYYAFVQDFSDGYQDDTDKDDTLRVRAVRRFIIH